MDGLHGAHRSVRVTPQCRQVTVDLPDGGRTSLSYPGLLLTAYEGDRKVYEKWVPLGTESSEHDDERFIEALHEAYHWQTWEEPPEEPDP